MRYLKSLCMALTVSALVACGGGGGSAGTPVGTVKTGTITLQLRDSAGNATSVVGTTGPSTVVAAVADGTGKAVANRLVTFTADATQVAFNPASGQVLTDSNGFASAQVTPLTQLVSGAGSITATALVDNASVTKAIDFQLTPLNLSLASLNLGSGALDAYSSRAVSVQVNLSGAPVTNAVQVTFTASCGTVTPATVTTDASGRAATTYSASAANCAGSNVTITAAAPGATSLSGQIAVRAAQATNLQFVSAAPQLIYLRDSGGATQSIVTFKVIDSVGNPRQNEAVNLSFVNSNSGVSLDTIGNGSSIVKTTDGAGLVSVAVFSGTVPAPVQVKAALVSNPAVQTTSAILTVASGRPAQKASSIAATLLSIEGFSVDGVTSTVTFSIADRQGNPVPDGTVVNFTTQSGVMIPPTCVISGGTSACSADLRSQGTRPANGRISVLAYVQGEEDFVDAPDANGVFNNVYDAGEQFTDLGNAYRDDDKSGIYTNGEFTVPRPGSVGCTGGTNGRANTCDGVWGANEVRREMTVIFATGTSKIALNTANSTGISLLLSDLNGNSVPTGTTLTATKNSGPDDCVVKGVVPGTVPNTTAAAPVSITLEKCTAGSTIDLTTTTPRGLATTHRIVLQ